MKVVPVTVGPIRVSGVPSLDSCVFTTKRKISEPNISGFNSTLQVSITSDSTSWRELATSLVSVTEDEGTI